MVLFSLPTRIMNLTQYGLPLIPQEVIVLREQIKITIIRKMAGTHH